MELGLATALLHVCIVIERPPQSVGGASDVDVGGKIDGWLGERILFVHARECVVCIKC